MLVSTRSGQPIAEVTLDGALRHIIVDILSEPLRWDKVLQNLVASLYQVETCLVTLGPVRAADSLARELGSSRNQTVKRIEVRPERRKQAKKTSGDIAIVGLAGRMPGAETLEEAWRVLEEGKDLHRKVIDMLRSLTLG